MNFPLRVEWVGTVENNVAHVYDATNTQVMIVFATNREDLDELVERANEYDALWREIKALQGAVAQLTEERRKLIKGRGKRQ